MAKFPSLFSHKKFTLLVLFSSVATLAIARVDRTDLDMGSLHVDELYFPQNFLFGFASAHYHVDGEDGSPDSQWAHFERTSPEGGKPHIEGNQRSGSACEFKRLYKEDIALMKNVFSANTFRDSVAWDRIEPREGEFNEKELQHFVAVVDELKRNGIEPMITLHHFVHPQWFEEKGGFLNDDNIKYFVRFSKKVFEALGSKVKLWCTVNEPNVFTFQGYLPFNCVFPPKTGSFGNWTQSWDNGARVLKNLLQAHTEVYQALKAMPHGKTAQIGFAHQYLQFEGIGLNPLTRIAGYFHNEFMDAPLKFLKTGHYNVRGIEYSAEGKLCDFVGLNFYAPPVIVTKSWNPIDLGGGCHQGEIMTDMPYPIRATTIYKAIQDVGEVGVPIYITENGISDKTTTNDWRRVKWIRDYLKVVSLAIEDGYDVRGYYYWTLLDNFEWNMGYHQQFGLVGVDFKSPSKTRTVKEGSRVYADIIKAARAGKLQNPTQDHLVDGGATQ